MYAKTNYCEPRNIDEVLREFCVTVLYNKKSRRGFRSELDNLSLDFFFSCIDRLAISAASLAVMVRKEYHGSQESSTQKGITICVSKIIGLSTYWHISLNASYTPPICRMLMISISSSSELIYFLTCCLISNFCCSERGSYVTIERLFSVSCIANSLFRFIISFSSFLTISCKQNKFTLF